ncbi:MAG: hypothetical protein L0H59_09190 [Tomitella sp.]|nr:hypothetical protein [Tomitella sp.]
MSDQVDLLDVLSGRADAIDRKRAARQQWDERRSSCPDGRVLEVGETWCGRCGATIGHYDLVINHDLGFLGCPAESDPTWSRYKTVGFRCAVGYGQGILTVADLCDRWDRQHFADCACGHPWGVHGDGATCQAYCACQAYTVNDPDE